MYLVATNINDACVEAIQCTKPFGPNSECSEKQGCICTPGHYFDPTQAKCIVSKGK
jgi:hypothetical protein